MAYKTYTTKAIVCGSRASHTSDKSYLLFTEGAGMLWATARSVREEKSKQRYALQDFSSIRASLVKGKSGWRIGSVEAESNVFMSAPSQHARAGLASVVNLLRRLLHGEEINPEVFIDVIDLFAALPPLSAEEVGCLVDQFTLRLLWHLGYVAEEASYQDVLTTDDWWRRPAALPPPAASAIKRGLEVSHL